MSASRSAERFFFMGPTRAERQLQPVGDREDVVGEQREIVAGLAIGIVECGAVERRADKAWPAERNRKIGKSAGPERRSTEIDRRNASRKPRVVELRKSPERSDARGEVCRRRELTPSDSRIVLGNERRPNTAGDGRIETRWRNTRRESLERNRQNSPRRGSCHNGRSRRRTAGCRQPRASRSRNNRRPASRACYRTHCPATGALG